MKRLAIIPFLILFALACHAQVVSYGSGTSSGGWAMPISNPLVSIAISGPASINVPNTGNFTALGTFANNATPPTDLTAAATWTSSDPTIATISGSGTPRVATCLKGGNVTLTATSAGVSGTFFFPCVKLLTGVSISPLTPTQTNGSSTYRKIKTSA